MKHSQLGRGPGHGKTGKPWSWPRSLLVDLILCLSDMVFSNWNETYFTKALCCFPKWKGYCGRTSASVTLVVSMVLHQLRSSWGPWEMVLLDRFSSMGNGWNNQWLVLAWLNIKSFLRDKHPQSWHWLCSKRIKLCGPWRMTVVEHKERIIFLEETLLHFFQIISMSSLRKGSYNPQLL